MLRIKSEEWDKFCQNIESLGFVKDFGGCEDIYVKTVEEQCFVCINNDDKIISFRKLNTNNTDYCYYNFDTIFDLIQLGYIEKTPKLYK